MAPKRRGGRGKGKQTHRQNNPAAAGREFPSEVIFAILSRLPVKSVVRFTCASKSWRTLVSLPSFAAAHLSRSPAALLIHGESAQVPGHIAYAFRPPNPESGHPSGTIDRIRKFPGSDAGVAAGPNVVVGAAPNGVVCTVQDRLAQNFTLWNPATGSSLRIPAPKAPSPDALLGASAGIGYNPDSKGFAIIRIVRYHVLEQPDVAHLFNFQNGRWDNLGPVSFRPVEMKCDAVVDGVPYWRAWESEEELGGPMLKLAWFDVRKSAFRSEWFGWVEPEKKEIHLSEIRAGHLGAIVWGRAGDRNPEERVLDVWTRAANGLWSQTYRVDPLSLPFLGRVLGFFGEEELVQEIILGPAENWKPALCIIKLGGDGGGGGGDVGVRGYCNLVGVRLGSCTVTRYRESLTRLPKIGCAMI